MRLSWFAEFFGAIPEALRALYEFGDPSGRGQGWWGFLILFIWGFFFVAVPLAIAKATYRQREWVSATMGVIAGTAIFWWVYGILPSAFLYYVDANKEILRDAIIPATFAPTIGGTRLDIASNLYDVIRDLVVVVQHLVALGATVWAALAIQKRFPRTLPAGEPKRESGGYH